MHISLTPTLEALVRRKVQSGLYNNASEVVREALRLMADRDESYRLKRNRLRRALIAGEESGLVDDYDIEHVIAELDSKSGAAK